MDLKEGQRLKLTTIGRRGDIKEMTKLSREQFMRIFPALKLSFNFLGKSIIEGFINNGEGTLFPFRYSGEMGSH